MSTKTPGKPPTRKRDRNTAAGQEADRIGTEMSNIHDGFGKGRAKDDGRETAREVAKRQGEKNR
jgi:hypothetical protein